MNPSEIAAAIKEAHELIPQVEKAFEDLQDLISELGNGIEAIKDRIVAAHSAAAPKA